MNFPALQRIILYSNCGRHLEGRDGLNLFMLGLFCGGFGWCFVQLGIRYRREQALFLMYGGSILALWGVMRAGLALLIGQVNGGLDLVMLGLAALLFGRLHPLWSKWTKASSERVALFLTCSGALFTAWAVLRATFATLVAPPNGLHDLMIWGLMITVLGWSYPFWYKWTEWPSEGGALLLKLGGPMVFFLGVLGLVSG